MDKAFEKIQHDKGSTSSSAMPNDMSIPYVFYTGIGNGAKSD